MYVSAIYVIALAMQSFEIFSVFTFSLCSFQIIFKTSTNTYYPEKLARQGQLHCTALSLDITNCPTFMVIPQLIRSLLSERFSNIFGEIDCQIWDRINQLSFDSSVFEILKNYVVLESRPSFLVLQLVMFFSALCSNLAISVNSGKLV